MRILARVKRAVAQPRTGKNQSGCAIRAQDADTLEKMLRISIAVGAHPGAFQTWYKAHMGEEL